MSKKNKRGRPKQKTFLNPRAYAYSLSRKTAPMTDAEIADTIEHRKDYDPDGSRGIEICDAWLHAVEEGKALLRVAFITFNEVIRPKMSERMRRA